MLEGGIGAVIGFIVGLIVAMAAGMMITMLLGTDTAELTAFIFLLPLCAIAGGLAGAYLGSHDRLGTLLRASGVTIGVAVVALCVAISRVEADLPQVSGPAIEPDGCHNEYRGIVLFTMQGEYEQFERLCGAATQGTMNLSLLAGATTDTTQDVPRGPGNVLVLEVPNEHRRKDFPTRIMVGEMQGGRQVIRYDYRARIISQHAHVGEVDFSFVPDSLP